MPGFLRQHARVEAQQRQRALAIVLDHPVPDVGNLAEHLADHFLELLRKAGGNAASYALDNGLVDQLATRDEMTQAVIKEVGEADDHGWKGVGLKEYLAAIPEQYPQSGKDEVGLITASGANRVLCMDLHAAQIQGFFDIPVDNLYASPVFALDIEHHFKGKM